MHEHISRTLAVFVAQATIQRRDANPNHEFIFSIQTASTGPSNNNHFWVGSSSAQITRIIQLSTPSNHSPVAKLYSPYNSAKLRAFGFIGCTATAGQPGFLLLFIRMNAPCKHFQVTDFAVLVSPIIMEECLEFLVSYNSITFFTAIGIGCKPLPLNSSSIATLKSL
uniref:Uncharacterized protein n=1 Tax=Glossina palpalis gambiensis TaxID=67801 RepID=A0A1B0C1E0_9MUSC